MREQGMFDPARLVFIDETAVSTNLTRLRGRAPCGMWVIASVPLGTWQTITFVAALRNNKMMVPMVVQGAMNGELFLAYIKQCLVPALRRGDTVVMDNCRIHLRPGIREAIEKAGATLRYLPKYSPDLNPIEMPYSKFKAFLAKWRLELFRVSNAPFARSSRKSARKNVPTISGTRAMLQYERNQLSCPSCPPQPSCTAAMMRAPSSLIPGMVVSSSTVVRKGSMRSFTSRSVDRSRQWRCRWHRAAEGAAAAESEREAPITQSSGCRNHLLQPRARA
jgi:transposase